MYSRHIFLGYNGRDGDGSTTEEDMDDDELYFQVRAVVLHSLSFHFTCVPRTFLRAGSTLDPVSDPPCDAVAQKAEHAKCQNADAAGQH